ncbi:hypothetical protein [Hymenobacter daeguensis]
MDINLSQALENFIGFFENGMFIVPPDSNRLGNYSPNFIALNNQRDELGIIGQIQEDNITIDTGDSAHKTGIIAFCNSREDQALLHNFERNGIMVRHPSHVPWNNWKNCSRDQLLAYVSGCWRSNQNNIVSRLLDKHYERTIAGIPTCQNTEADYEGTTKSPAIGDPLAPHDIMFLRVCSGIDNAHLDLLGQFALQVAIEVTPKSFEDEYTQLLLEAIVCGRLDLFVQVHTEYKKNLRYYWTRRKQSEIAESLIHIIELELPRYEGQFPIPLLIPTNLLNEIYKLDLINEILSIDPIRKIELANRFLQAAFKDTQQYALYLYKLNIALLNIAGKALTWVGDGIADVINFIGEGISFAVNVLLDGLTQRGQDLNKLFQQFADQIVNRLSVKMKEIIDEAFYNDNMLELKVKTTALEQTYRQYLIVKEEHKLEYAENVSNEINALAISLGLSALGIFSIQKLIQIAIFNERAKSNPKYKETIPQLIAEAENHINGLYERAKNDIKNGFTYTSHLLSKPKDPAELQANRYKIYYDGILLNEIELPVEKVNGKMFENHYQSLIADRQKQLKNEVFNTAFEIITTLKQ